MDMAAVQAPQIGEAAGLRPKAATVTAAAAPVIGLRTDRPMAAGSPIATLARPATPVAAPDRRFYNVRIHWPYVLAEAFFVAYQVAWAVLFATWGLWLCAVGATWMAACVVAVAWFYGDHAGKRCFVFEHSSRARRR